MSGAQRLAPALSVIFGWFPAVRAIADLRPVHQVGRAQDGDVVLSALGRIEVKIPVLGAYYRGVGHEEFPENRVLVALCPGVPGQGIPVPAAGGFGRAAGTGHGQEQRREGGDSAKNNFQYLIYEFNDILPEPANKDTKNTLSLYWPGGNRFSVSARPVLQAAAIKKPAGFAMFLYIAVNASTSMTSTWASAEALIPKPSVSQTPMPSRRPSTSPSTSASPSITKT